MNKKEIFLIDFDITISQNDSTDTLMQVFNPEKHTEIKAKYRNGEITMREYLKDGLESLKITKEQFLETLKLVKIDETFKHFVKSGHEFKIVSAGTTLNILGALEHSGIKLLEEDVISNGIFFDGNKITITNPYLDAEEYYGVDKKEIVEKYKKQGYKVYFLGDGPSDYRAIEIADFVFIRKGTRAVKFCQENDIPFEEFADFDEVLRKVGNKKI